MTRSNSLTCLAENFRNVYVLEVRGSGSTAALERLLRPVEEDGFSVLVVVFNFFVII